MARKTKPEPKKPKTKSRAPSEEAIRKRAFEIYTKRGGEPGHEKEDWERAKKELENRKRR